MSLQQIINYFDLNKRANVGMTKYEPWACNTPINENDLSQANVTTKKVNVISASRVTPAALAARRALRRTMRLTDDKVNVISASRVAPTALARHSALRLARTMRLTDDKGNTATLEEFISKLEANSENEAKVKVIGRHTKATRIRSKYK